MAIDSPSALGLARNLRDTRFLAELFPGFGCKDNFADKIAANQGRQQQLTEESSG